MWTFVERKQHEFYLLPVFIFKNESGEEMHISQDLLRRDVASVSEYDPTGKIRFRYVEIPECNNTREFYHAIEGVFDFITTHDAEKRRIVSELEKLTHTVVCAFSSENGLCVRWHPTVYCAPRTRANKELEALMGELCPKGYSGKMLKRKFGHVVFIYRKRPQQ